MEAERRTDGLVEKLGPGEFEHLLDEQGQFNTAIGPKAKQKEYQKPSSTRRNRAADGLVEKLGSEVYLSLLEEQHQI